MCLVGAVHCQVEVSTSGWSPVQRSPTDYGVSGFDREASLMRRTWPTSSCCGMEIIACVLDRIRRATWMQSQTAFPCYCLPHSHQFLFINLPWISLHMLTLVSQKTVQRRDWFLLRYYAKDNSLFVTLKLVFAIPECLQNSIKWSLKRCVWLIKTILLFVTVVLVSMFPLPCQNATHSGFGTSAVLLEFENLLRVIIHEYVLISLFFSLSFGFNIAVVSWTA
jgi:hypothetical protein